MREVPRKGTFRLSKKHDRCSLYLDVTRSEFYRVLMNPLSHVKFARVNDSLNRKLVGFNENESNKVRRNPRHFSPHLAEHKGAEKYRGRDDHDVLQRDKKKPLEEIGIAHGEQKEFTHAVIAYSLKKVGRILGFGYISDQGKSRVFVRYSTLSEHPQSAEEVIRSIRETLGLPVIDDSSILE